MCGALGPHTLVKAARRGCRRTSPAGGVGPAVGRGAGAPARAAGGHLRDERAAGITDTDVTYRSVGWLEGEIRVRQGMAKHGSHLAEAAVAAAEGVRMWASAGAMLAVLLLLAIRSAPADALAQRGHVPAGSFGAALASEGDTALSGPSAIAVDEASGDSDVLDAGNNRVLRFGPAPEHRFLEAWGFGVSDGAKTYEQCTSECAAGLAGTRPGEFDAPEAIAVDNSGGPSEGDVYAAANRTFTHAAVDKFSGEGKQLTQLPEEEDLVEGMVVGVAVGADGSVWVEREDEETEFLLEHFND